jgi:hypothetical protein
LQGAFGDPYLQQISILVTWLPVALVLLQGYYYSYTHSALTEGRPPPGRKRNQPEMAPVSRSQRRRVNDSSDVQAQAPAPVNDASQFIEFREETDDDAEQQNERPQIRQRARQAVQQTIRLQVQQHPPPMQHHAALQYPRRHPTATQYEWQDNRWVQRTDEYGAPLVKEVQAERPWSNGFWYFMIVLTILCFISMVSILFYLHVATLVGRASVYVPGAFDLMMNHRTVHNPTDTAHPIAGVKFVGSVSGKTHAMTELLKGTYTTVIPQLMRPAESKHIPTKQITIERHDTLVMVPDNTKIVRLPPALNDTSPKAVTIELVTAAFDDPVEPTMSPRNDTMPVPVPEQLVAAPDDSVESAPSVCNDTTPDAVPELAPPAQNDTQNEPATVAVPDTTSSATEVVQEGVALFPDDW